MFDYGKPTQRAARNLAPVIYGRLKRGEYTAVNVPLVLVIYLEKYFGQHLKIERVGGDDEPYPYCVTLKE